MNEYDKLMKALHDVIREKEERITKLRRALVEIYEMVEESDNDELQKIGLHAKVAAILVKAEGK